MKISECTTQGATTSSLTATPLLLKRLPNPLKRSLRTHKLTIKPRRHPPPSCESPEKRAVPGPGEETFRSLISGVLAPPGGLPVTHGNSMAKIYLLVCRSHALLHPCLSSWQQRNLHTFETDENDPLSVMPRAQARLQISLEKREYHPKRDDSSHLLSPTDAPADLQALHHGEQLSCLEQRPPRRTTPAWVRAWNSWEK